MDRDGGAYAFTLQCLCDLINRMDFESVEVFEPHSDVTTALLHRCTAKYLAPNLLRHVIKRFQDILPSKTHRIAILLPDAGAMKRYASSLPEFPNVWEGVKDRDFKTGRIKSMRIACDIAPAPTIAFIVDDLCCKGGTFLLAAEQLRKLGATQIYLVVPHCERSISQGGIMTSDLINKVFTLPILIAKDDPIINASNGKIQVVEDFLYA